MSVKRSVLASVTVISAYAFCVHAQTTPTTAPAVQQTASGLKIIIQKPGAATSQKGDTLYLRYTGKLADGTVFDSTDKHGGKPFGMKLGAGQVIKGWDEGLMGMAVGEKRQLIIPPELGYGAAGSPPAIPANATLTFDVELVALIRLETPK